MQITKLQSLRIKSLDAQLRAHTGDGFGYSSFHNEGDTSKLEPSGILVHKPTGRRFKVPLPVFTPAQFEKQPQTDVWTTERDDWDCWPEIRHKYMGKRTCLSNVNGATVLLIEDIDFTIEA